MFAENNVPLALPPFVMERNAVRLIYVGLKNTLAALEFMGSQAWITWVFTQPFDALGDSVLQIGRLALQPLLELGRHLKRNWTHLSSGLLSHRTASFGSSKTLPSPRASSFRASASSSCHSRVQ